MNTIITNIINVLNKYNWSGLLGVLIGAIITSYFASKRERKKLIKDLQIKATEDLIESILKAYFALSKFQSLIITLKTLISSNKIIADNYLTNTNVAEEFSLLRRQYIECEVVFMNKIESKRVIFKKFWGIRNYLFDEGEAFSDINKDIYNILIFMYQQNALAKKPLNYKEIEKLKDLCEKFMEKSFDLLAYMEDFQVELQNEFLSKLFKYKVPRRELIDESLKVLTTDLKYESKRYDKFLKKNENINI